MQQIFEYKCISIYNNAMKRNILSLLLLPFFLLSCSFLEDDKKPNEKEDTNTQEQEETPPQKEEYPLVYDGPSVVFLNYGDSYQISGVHLEGTNKDPELTYTCSSTTYKNSATVNENGVVTAMEYNRNLSENTNENVVVYVRSKYSQNDRYIPIRFVICHFQEDVDFDTFLYGENYYFYTSTGIVENLKCHYADAEETEPWYAECTLVEEETGKYFNTTISKSFH